MGTPYVGEIRMFAGNFAPVGWAFCDGQLLPISENDTLFNLIGTTYGGDGQETFALPNLQSRIPIHMGTGPDGTTYQIGEMAGTESETLSTQQIPVHNHYLSGRKEQGNTSNPSGAVPAMSTLAPYTDPEDTTVSANKMHAQAIQSTGGSQPHNNLQPYLCVNFIISLYGIFPQPT
ncbi:microcystin-dependent protein [Paenibacillus phyllosphaerae]|uniref:Microcystin-dependent protein n=1 Tax=Paenibacillus phyllosphaerae TaxID=274593 RepID=A0A7W5FPG4_9BACL|nr:tail fiber protein [Paenibacillus phyllosphaerae]MBB3112004.1 microcystin-dependent protein [Paenibacillus phyllosphaerae]